MKRNRTLLIGGTFLALLVALGVTQAMLERAAAQQAGVEAPRFEVDPLWPKPLPNNWVLGQAIGVWADDQDVIWIIHRGSSTLADNEKALELKNGECCAGAPPVLAFDANGNLVRSWGGPGQGYDWPAGNHGIFIDHLGNVWIGGNGPGDSHLLKFTHDGSICVHAARGETPESVVIAVRDTGIGIAPADRDTIFDDFHQVDSSVARPYGGTGLGLSICRRLATILGGRITLESEVGRGSTFALVLPVRLRK